MKFTYPVTDSQGVLAETSQKSGLLCVLGPWVESRELSQCLLKVISGELWEEKDINRLSSIPSSQGQDWAWLLLFSGRVNFESQIYIYSGNRI